MQTTIVMPQLGESVAEGVIGKWLKNEGDQVAKDEPIVEVITDKVNAEIPSPVAGTLEKIAQPEGATVAVGQEIAIIGDGETHTAPPAGDAEDASVRTPVGATAPTAGDNGQRPSGGTAASAVATRPAISTPEPGGRYSDARGERVRSSPLVRRLAEQNGINLAAVPGTGIGGRVSKHDILSFVERQRLEPAAAPAALSTETVERPAVTAPPTQPAVAVAEPAPKPPVSPAPRQTGDSEELIAVSPLRKMIADRMTLSVSSIPHATTMSEVDMSSVVRYREARKEEYRKREDVPLSYVAFVIKATIEALKEFPYVNAEWAGDSIILKREININVAVDAPEGLTTPVIHRADERSLSGISRAISDLAVRARNKKLKIEDMQGGTFTVNNTGALGSVSGVSIINHPQGGILSAGTIVKRPVVVEVDGQDLIAVRSMMNLSFTFDHRLMDGGYAAGFVRR